MNGLFITMEGVDGSGKSLQAKRLFDHLTARGFNVIITREPGGTKISEQIREMIIDKSNTGMAPLTEAFLYAASRAQIVAELIRPALLDGKIVICDRFLDSSIAYQGYARGIGPENVDIINSYATSGLKPDITFLFDIEPEASLLRKRQMAIPDRLESEALDFHHKVYYGYKALAEKHPERISIIDASLPPDAIAHMVTEKVESLLS